MDKRYEEALERAKELHEAGNALTKAQIEIVFPELKESEDERIRTRLIALVEAFGQGEYKDEMLAYLERQKEQKILPGFDELTPDEEMSHPLYLKGFDAGRKVQTVFDEQKPSESGAIKGGDFISDGKRVFLVLANVKERNLGETGSTFCESHILGVDGVVYCNGDDFKKFKRATSDERAKFIHDLKVGVKLKEQPSEWSEEDTEMYINVACSLRGYACGLENEGHKKHIKKELDWFENRFKSLHPQPKQEWSEEDEFFRQQLIVYCENCVQDTLAAKCVDWLKSLRPQPHWEPSEEQMEALKYALGKGGTYNKEALDSLLTDLQKLL